MSKPSRLEPCPDCGQPVSAFAEACPGCGLNIRRRRSGQFVGVFIAVIIGLIVLFFIAAKVEDFFK